MQYPLDVRTSRILLAHPEPCEYVSKNILDHHRTVLVNGSLCPDDRDSLLHPKELSILRSQERSMFPGLHFTTSTKDSYQNVEQTPLKLAHSFQFVSTF